MTFISTMSVIVVSGDRHAFDEETVEQDPLRRFRCCPEHRLRTRQLRSIPILQPEQFLLRPQSSPP